MWRRSLRTAGVATAPMQAAEARKFPPERREGSRLALSHKPSKDKVPGRKSSINSSTSLSRASSAPERPADVTAYLASRPSEEAFRETLREEAQHRVGAMERGTTLIKFNAGKGMFGKKSDASRMVERWVVLNTKLGGPNTELAWGDPKTKKLSSQVRLSECRRVLYGQRSETLQSMTFNPHPAWLCFSVETHAGRTFDFAASSVAEAHTWVCGLSAFIRPEIDHGWLLWKTLEMKMTEDLSLAGLPGMVKRVAQRLQLEGNEGELARIRNELAEQGDGGSPASAQLRPPAQVPADAPPTASAAPATATSTEPPPPRPPRPPPGAPVDLDADQYTYRAYSEYEGKQQ